MPQVTEEWFLFNFCGSGIEEDSGAGRERVTRPAQAERRRGGNCLLNQVDEGFRMQVHSSHNISG